MQIYLRPITESDGVNIVKWRNNPIVRSHCLDKSLVTADSNSAFFKSNVETGRYKQYIVECLEEVSGVCAYPIATVYLKDMDYGNHRCELCIFTSPDAEWNKEAQEKAISMLTEKAFNEFGMHKVYSYVFKKFPNEADLLRKVGFTIEATLKQEALNENGEYEDLYRLSIINPGDKSFYKR